MPKLPVAQAVWVPYPDFTTGLEGWLWAGGAHHTGDSTQIDAEHLQTFVEARRGVEGFVEPRTAVSDVTLLLVAFDGEWTRRVVPSPEWAHAFAESLQIPGYDAAVVGYPQRMRDYNTRNKKHPDLR